MRILLLSDIHANFPALEAIGQRHEQGFETILNCGDSTVYATFPNQTLAWLRKQKALSILGNTDTKVVKLLRGKNFKKPRKAEKRIMYTWTAEHLDTKGKADLQSFPEVREFELGGFRMGMYHGSPNNPNEQLFNDSPGSRFQELARKTDREIICIGHSHTPFHKKINSVHFINPGSVGRMFDSDPRASYAILDIDAGTLKVKHHRIAYPIERSAKGISDEMLPPLYADMFRLGKKLN